MEAHYSVGWLSNRWLADWGAEAPLLKNKKNQKKDLTNKKFNDILNIELRKGSWLKCLKQ